MSKARFDWLEQWTLDPADDIVRTPGTESNVKEIYDACNEMALDGGNVIVNQFSEFSNHLGHYSVTGAALERLYEHVAADRPGSRLAAFVSASGSAGTLGAGDYLKDRHGCRIVAAEALECPTLLENGYGEHNIQGIGDKHVPLIHNVMNTDDIVAVSDVCTDSLDVLFNTPAGRDHLVDRAGLDAGTVGALTHMGYSSSCNALAAIAVAEAHDMGRDDVIVTVATDGSELYDAEREAYVGRHHRGGYDDVAAAASAYRERPDRRRGRRGAPLGLLGGGASADLQPRATSPGWSSRASVFEDFVARRDQRFWDGMRHFTDDWDELIVEFNGQTGARDDDLSGRELPRVRCRHRNFPSFAHHCVWLKAAGSSFGARQFVRWNRGRQQVSSTFERYAERLEAHRIVEHRLVAVGARDLRCAGYGRSGDLDDGGGREWRGMASRPTPFGCGAGTGRGRWDR